MNYCTKCGQPLAEGTRFCSNCGAPAYTKESSGSERKTVYDGEIHKCPSCGEVLRALDTICPSCGHELRGRESSNSIKNLSDKLVRTPSEKQRIQIIRNFPIPNTKEDLFEFMILASSNFDAGYYAAHLNVEDESDAWLSKVEQCYQKANWIITDSSELAKFELIYNKIINSCESNKKLLKQNSAARSNRLQKAKNRAIIKKRVITLIFTIIILILCLTLLFALGGAFNTEPDAIKIGVSSSDCKGQYYLDIEELFEEKGFTNIETREDGWNILHKSGDVKTITVDGKDSFESYTKVSKDAKIIIFYYK